MSFGKENTRNGGLDLELPTSLSMSSQIRWQQWCWGWSSNTLATWGKGPIHWKRPWSWERLRQEENRTTEDEMVGWHDWLNGHEFEQALGDGERQRSLACCSPWGHKELDTIEWLKWTKLNCFLFSKKHMPPIFVYCFVYKICFSIIAYTQWT